MLHAPDTEVPLGLHTNQLYIGTDHGNIYILTLSDKLIKKYTQIDWKAQFPTTEKLFGSTNPVTAIKMHKSDPNKVLIAFKKTGAMIWDFNVLTVQSPPQ